MSKKEYREQAGKKEENQNKENNGKKEKLENPELVIQKAKEDYQALWDKYLRSCADFDNARKRWEKEKEELIKYANFSLLKELLVVLDETEQALNMVKKHNNIEETVKGLELAYSNFINILKKRGLKTIEAVGKKFDPHYHEIVYTKEIDDTNEYVVLEEIQKGYIFEDKVLRPSKVIVGIKKIEENKEPEQKLTDTSLSNST